MTHQALLSHLIQGREPLMKSTFYNPNLRTNRIFVDESNPANITGYIDWHSAGYARAYKQVE